MRSANCEKCGCLSLLGTSLTKFFECGACGWVTRSTPDKTVAAALDSMALKCARETYISVEGKGGGGGAGLGGYCPPPNVVERQAGNYVFDGNGGGFVQLGEERLELRDDRGDVVWSGKDWRDLAELVRGAAATQVRANALADRCGELERELDDAHRTIGRLTRELERGRPKTNR